MLVFIELSVIVSDLRLFGWLVSLICNRYECMVNIVV